MEKYCTCIFLLEIIKIQMKRSGYCGTRLSRRDQKTWRSEYHIQLHYEQQLGACLLEHGWDLGPLTSRLGEVFWRTVADWWDEIRGVR